MKKVLALILALTMVLALGACAAKTEAPAAPADQAPADAAPADAAPADSTPADAAPHDRPHPDPRPR